MKTNANAAKKVKKEDVLRAMMAPILYVSMDKIPQIMHPLHISLLYTAHQNSVKLWFVIVPFPLIFSLI